jgi:ribonucleoside-triphosphate reductase
VRRIALVRRRDGETEPFDPGRIVDDVHRALLASGQGDVALPDEIGALVSLFLEKTFYDQIPTVAQVEDMVEKVLIETGHAAAAKAFILHRERRERLREAHEARTDLAAPTLFGPHVIQVDDHGYGTTHAYVREPLARRLAADGTVARPVADEVAARVEQRLRQAGVARAPAALVHALAASEVFDRVSDVAPRRRADALIPHDVVAASLLRPGGEGAAPWPSRAALDLGAAALRSYSLTELLPASVATAHLSGDVHVHGLGAPAALFAVSLTPEQVKAGRAPDGGTRRMTGATRGAGRLVAVLGRALRMLGGAVVQGAAAQNVPAALATQLLDATDEEFAEAGWLLLHECSRAPGATAVELDLSPEVADRLADLPAVDGAGNDLSLPRGELGAVATRLAAATLRAYLDGSDLPPAAQLPIPSVTVSERTVTGEGSRSVLWLAAEAALAGRRVVFPLAREGAVPVGTSAARGVKTRDAGGAGPAAYCAGRVTLNLPRAALRAGRGNLELFLRHCDELVELAAEAHRSRRELLAELGARDGGCLTPLFRGGHALCALEDATWSVGVTGLNEALLVLTGFELHEGGEEGVRTARKILNYLSLRVREVGLGCDLRTSLDADEDPALAARLRSVDRRSDRGGADDAFLDPNGYTPGIAVRAGAPVDSLLRIEREESLHRYVATATLRIPLRREEAGGPDGVLALLRKLLRTGEAVQVELRSW